MGLPPSVEFPVQAFLAPNMQPPRDLPKGQGGQGVVDGPFIFDAALPWHEFILLAPGRQVKCNSGQMVMRQRRMVGTARRAVREWQAGAVASARRPYLSAARRRYNRRSAVQGAVAPWRIFNRSSSRRTRAPAPTNTLSGKR